MKLTVRILNFISLLRCRKVLKQNEKKDYKYNSSICAIAKNEELYIKEWIDHHLSIGFNHIYILDNNEKEGLNSYLNNYIIKDSVTVIPYYNIKPQNQIAGYNYFLNNYVHLSRWIAFIDIDEFIQLPIHKQINDILCSYKSIPSIAMSWSMYGANNQIKYNPGNVVDRFASPAKSGHSLNEMNKCFKSIIQSVCYEKIRDCVFRSPHRWNFPVYNEHRKLILEETLEQTLDYIYINHYYTKSYEEFNQRCNKGNADGSNKKLDAFFTINDYSMKDAIESYKNGL